MGRWVDGLTYQVEETHQNHRKSQIYHRYGPGTFL